MKPDPTPIDAPAPPGFAPVKIGSSFASHSAQFHARWHEGHLQLGFRVQPHQCNPGNACHGGMLCLMADIVLSAAAQYQTDIPRQFLPTISLQTDFVAPAPLGSWVQGQADILRVTRTLVFSHGILSADGAPVVRTSGVFRRGPLLPEAESDHGLRLAGMPERKPAA